MFCATAQNLVCHEMPRSLSALSDGAGCTGVAASHQGFLFAAMPVAAKHILNFRPYFDAE